MTIMVLYFINYKNIVDLIYAQIFLTRLKLLMLVWLIKEEH